jgi:phosphopantetheinyl transferase
MHWLDDVDAITPALPAIWLIRTGANPRGLTERSTLRRGVARLILARQLGCREGEVAIAHDAAGRPLLDRPKGTGLHLSLATRGGIVAVALARQPLGVDVEQVDEKAVPPLDLLHPDERRAVTATDTIQRARHFARLWAAKEAYVKALGAGFRRAPESFAVSLLSETAFRVADAFASADVTGALRTMKNGGHEIMAAAIVMTGQAVAVSPPDRSASS